MHPPLVIVGGTSLVTPWLMRRLQAHGRGAEVISRQAVAVPEGFTFLQMDLSHARNWIVPEGAVVISLLPLWVLAQYLPRFIGAKAIVAIGSTSRFSKAESVDAQERLIAEKLERAEQVLIEWCVKSHVRWTLLRATMVYDGVTDKNIARMIKFIRRFRFLPLAAPALGLRQPIHADDVAQAILGCLDNERAYDKAMNIAGGEQLTYRAMATRVFQATGLTPRFLSLPTRWLQKMFVAGSKIGLLREAAFGSSIFVRMNQDLIFDTEEARAVLPYTPRAFMAER